MPDEEYYLVSRSDMEDVADTIREAGGTSDDLEWKSGWISAIEALAGGGTSWSTLADQNVTIVSSSPNYFVITSFTSAFGASETYRVTWGSGGTEFICQTIADNSGNSYDGYVIGNPGVVGGTDDGSGATFLIYRDSATRLVCATSTAAGTLHLKLEKQVSAGSGGTPRTSADLTVSGATVTAPAGVYASDASKSVASGTVTAPASISGTGASVSTGTNTLTLTKTVSVTPNVTTAGYISSGTAGNSSVSLQASVDTQGAQTIHPQALADRTIEAGTYLTGDQTIKHVEFTNLSAENIKSGVTVKVGDADSPGCVIEVLGTFAGSGASNCVTGTFKGTTTGAAMDVTLNYSGSGYPVAVVIYPAEGPYNSGTGTFYGSTQRYASQMYFVLKSAANTAPTYASTGSANYGTIMNRFKNSTSNSTSYNASAASGTNAYQDISATSGQTSIVKIKSSTKMSVFIASSSYGFLANIDYKYWVLYSS